MADAVAALLSFPPDDVASISPKKYDDSIRKFINSLSKVPAGIYLKQIDKKNMLDFLNPAVNTIPFLMALIDQIKAAGNDMHKLSVLTDHTMSFFSCFDPMQARYIGEQWRATLEWLMSTIRAAGSTDYSAITNAMLRLDPTGGTFTSTHLRLLRICLDSGAPSQALPILDKNVYAIPAEPPKNVPEELLSEEVELSNGFIITKSGFTYKIKPEWILEYYLLGAHVYIGLRNYNRARLFLEYVILTPCQQHATSTFQIEAYKKWVMVGLLAEGKRYPLPRTHDGAVMKNIQSVSKPYDALAESFDKRDWRKYQAEMDVGAAIWHEDGNLRLVKEAGDALLRYRVIDLQKTYAALPVSRVASELGFQPDPTLQMLTEMIHTRHLNASISPGGNGAGDAVLRFHLTSPSSSSTAAQDTELEAQTKRIEDLVTFVRDADRRLQLTKEYVEYQKRQKRAGPDADLADQMDLSWDNQPIGGMMDDDGDEDIMAG